MVPTWSPMGSALPVILLWIALIVAGVVVFAALVARILRLVGSGDLPAGLDEDEVRRLLAPTGSVRTRDDTTDDWTKP